MLAVNASAWFRAFPPSLSGVAPKLTSPMKRNTGIQNSHLLHWRLGEQSWCASPQISGECHAQMGKVPTKQGKQSCQTTTFTHAGGAIPATEHESGEAKVENTPMAPSRNLNWHLDSKPFDGAFHCQSTIGAPNCLDKGSCSNVACASCQCTHCKCGEVVGAALKRNTRQSATFVSDELLGSEVFVSEQPQMGTKRGGNMVAPLSTTDVLRHGNCSHDRRLR